MTTFRCFAPELYLYSHFVMYSASIDQKKGKSESEKHPRSRADTIYANTFKSCVTFKSPDTK